MSPEELTWLMDIVGRKARSKIQVALARIPSTNPGGIPMSHPYSVERPAQRRISYDLPAGHFEDEEGRYVDPGTVAAMLQEAEAALEEARRHCRHTWRYDDPTPGLYTRRHCIWCGSVRHLSTFRQEGPQ